MQETGRTCAGKGHLYGETCYNQPNENPRLCRGFIFLRAINKPGSVPHER